MLYRGFQSYANFVGGKIAPALTSHLASKYTHIRSFRKFTFYYQDLLNFADVSIFFLIKLAF